VGEPRMGLEGERKADLKEKGARSLRL